MGKESEIYAGPTEAVPDIDSRMGRVRNGIHLLPIRDETVTLSHVQEIMDEEDAADAKFSHSRRADSLPSVILQA